MSDLTPVLRKRSRGGNPSSWYVFIPGTAVWFPTRTQDEIEARQILRRVIEVGLPDAARALKHDAMTRKFWRRMLVGRNITVRTAVDEYLATRIMQGKSESTVQTASSILDLWIRSGAVGNLPLSSIVVDHVAPFVNTADMAIGYSRRCLRLNVLRWFFDWCVQGEKMPISPCANMFVRTDGIPQEKLVPKKKVPFTDDEIARLLAGIPVTSWWHGAVLIGKYFGLRISSVASLEWASLPELKRIRIFTRKGRVVVDEPLPEEVAAWFRTWPVEGGAGFCFPKVATMVPRLSFDFTLICRKLGIPNRSFQCLRVRVVTNGINSVLEQLGGEERAVMSSLLLRHGLAGVQKIVGHVAGSSVTAGRYFNPQKT